MFGNNWISGMMAKAYMLVLKIIARVQYYRKVKKVDEADEVGRR
jgi:hypothetical protein